ncbi:hypothetical protein NDU88_001327 [Pleurodeles waltl]|uniref:Uncharacterized protein n=1 Tax=Pleurodeles waltl TaxID=8319 RepID=A0AAV7MJE3_PLEWA|nr:hypothetical protein NDU88_001327 [Pleurodeles waltl]
MRQEAQPRLRAAPSSTGILRPASPSRGAGGERSRGGAEFICICTQPPLRGEKLQQVVCHEEEKEAYSACCGNRKSSSAPPIAEVDWRKYILTLYAENPEKEPWEMDLNTRVRTEVNCWGPPSVSEIKRFIRSMRASGAVGPDELPMSLIK